MNVYDMVKRKFILPHAYEDWEDYRSAITRHILQLASKISDSSITNPSVANMSLAVLGAGRCNDLDLISCSDVFGQITLIDEDPESLQAAVSRIRPDLRKNISIQEASLSGITPNDIRILCAALLEYVRQKGTDLSPDDYQSYVTEQLAHLERFLYKNPNELSYILPATTYDLVVCLGVHSQLFSMLSYCLETLDYNISQQFFHGHYSGMGSFQTQLTDMVHQIVPVLNDAILASAQAYAIIGCEHSNNSPVAGAYHSIENIRKRPLTANQVTESHLIWNFNPEQQIAYDMLIQTISTTI